MLKQRIVVEHVHNSRPLPQTHLQIRDHPPQSALGKWIEEVEHSWLGRKRKLSRIAAGRLERKALLRLAPVLVEILLSSSVQRGQKLHTQDTAKGIVRCHQESSSFARSQIDEDEVSKVRMILLSQGLEHFAEKIGFRGLIRRVKNSKQAVAPADRRAGGVDALLPIVFSVAVALAPVLRSGVASELPQRNQQSAGGCETAFAPSHVIPPAPRRTRQADLRRCGGIDTMHSLPS